MRLKMTGRPRGGRGRRHRGGRRGGATAAEGNRLPRCHVKIDKAFRSSPREIYSPVLRGACIIRWRSNVFVRPPPRVCFDFKLYIFIAADPARRRLQFGLWLFIFMRDAPPLRNVLPNFLGLPFCVRLLFLVALFGNRGSRRYDAEWDGRKRGTRSACFCFL